MGGKTRPPCSPEFRKQMMDWVRSGRSPASLAREFEPTETTIRNWQKTSSAADEKGRFRGGYPGLPQEGPLTL